MASQGLAICPRTHLPRIYSTLGAAALEIPVKQLLRYCVYRQVTEYLRSDVIGAGVAADQREIGTEVGPWLLSAQIDSAGGTGADLLVSRLRTKAVPTLNGYGHRLYQQRAGKVTVHFKSTQFTAALEAPVRSGPIPICRGSRSICRPRPTQRWKGCKRTFPGS